MSGVGFNSWMSLLLRFLSHHLIQVVSVRDKTSPFFPPKGGCFNAKLHHLTESFEVPVWCFCLQKTSILFRWVNHVICNIICNHSLWLYIYTCILQELSNFSPTPRTDPEVSGLSFHPRAWFVSFAQISLLKVVQGHEPFIYGVLHKKNELFIQGNKFFIQGN